MLDALTPSRRWLTLVALAGFAGALLLCLALGPTSISLSQVFDYLTQGAQNDPGGLIFWQIRLPRVLLAFLVGSALAIAGVILQGLLLNPLTDPYVTGVSSGAAVGASLAIFLGLPSVPWLTLLALGGGAAALVVVYAFGRRRGRVDIYILLLAGVTLSQLLTAVISLLLIKANQDTHAILYWLLGTFSGRGWLDVEIALCAVPFLAVPLFFSKELNMLLQGEQRAFELGVDVERAKRILLADAAALTAIAVSVSGVIGFVGLVIPHVARLITGPDHRKVLVLSIFLGAALMGLSDLAARTIIAPSELPVGVVTTFIGAPVFVYLLRSRRA